VDEVIEHWPARCQCGHVFSTGERVPLRAPARHQVEELPELAVKVTEHRCERLRCPDCGAERTGELAADVAASSFGPRLQAAVATLSVRNRISRRDAVELCEELFGARICAGSVDGGDARFVALVNSWSTAKAVVESRRGAPPCRTSVGG
jgi:hypothetical protein